MQKHKSAAMAPATMPRKASEKQRRGRGSSRSGTRTSAQEFALAKPLKPSKKFVAQSSGLSIAEKTSPTGVKIVCKKVSSTSTGGSDTTWASTRALDLFDSGSSASDGESTLSVPP
jgi:hypothetical protein